MYYCSVYVSPRYFQMHVICIFSPFSCSCTILVFNLIETIYSVKPILKLTVVLVNKDALNKKTIDVTVTVTVCFSGIISLRRLLFLPVGVLTVSRE